MIVYKSLFANDINAMLAFRTSLGFKKDSYEYNLGLFDRFCVANHPEASVLSRELVISWLDDEQLVRPGSILNRVTDIRYFAKYLESIGKQAYIIPRGIFKQKSDFTPYIFTDNELKRLFVASDNMPFRTYRPLQNKLFPVMFRLIYTCGLRPNEGRELLRQDVNLETGEILIRGNKKYKERRIIMSDDMLQMCQEYETQRLIFMPDSKAFFPCPKGNVYTNSMSLFMFNKCWTAANPNVTPSELQTIRVYDLRHRFASTVLNRWLDEKKDIYAMLPYLRAFMGHENLESTLYYVHLLPENLAKSTGVEWKNLESILPEVAE
jgi:integrase